MATIYKRGRIFYTSYYDGARWRAKTTRCTSRRAAEAVARQLEEAAAGVGPGLQAATLTQASALHLAAMLDRVERGELAEATLETNEGRLQQLCELLGPGLLVHQLDADRVTAYLDGRLQQVSRHTVTKERTLLRQVLRAARGAGWYPYAIEDVFPSGWRSGYRPRRRWLTEAEAEALCWALPPLRAALVGFTLATGASPSEAARAQQQDIGASVVMIRGTKTETRKRVLPILEHSRRWLPPPSCLPFQSWHNDSRDLKQACAAAGIEPCTLTDLRRTAGSWLYRRTGDASLVALFLGHSGVNMVLRVYGRLQGDELGAAIRRRLNNG